MPLRCFSLRITPLRCLLTPACYKLFQQVVTSPQMTNCNEPVLTDLLQLDEIETLLTSFNKPVKLKTCCKSVGFFVMTYVK